MFSDSTGRFDFKVPTGSMPRLDFQVFFAAGSLVHPWYFADVEVRDQVVLRHDVQRFQGRVVFPDAFAPSAIDSMAIELYEFGGSSEDVSWRYVRGETPLDADGGFDLYVPDATWQLELRLSGAVGIASGMVEWDPVAIGTGLELVVPLEKGTITIDSPSSLPEELVVRLSLDHSFEENGTRTTVRASQPYPVPTLPGPVWLASAHDGDEDRTYYGIDRYSSWRPLDGFFDETFTENVVDGVRQLVVSASPHLLTLRAVQSGEAVARHQFILVGIEFGRRSVIADDDGIAYAALPAGVYRIGFEAIESTPAQWTTVRVPERLDVTFEIPAD